MGWRRDFVKKCLLSIASILGVLFAIFSVLNELGLFDKIKSLF